MTEPADQAGFASYPSLRGRTVFVTGGATGIGAEFVGQFARQGAQVGFVDIQAEPAAKLAAVLAAELGTAPWYQACDVSDVPRLRDAMTERQLAGWVTPEAEREIDRAQCLPGRLRPADIARMALWLAADDSRMCTSQTWVVDGGWI